MLITVQSLAAGGWGQASSRGGIARHDQTRLDRQACLGTRNLKKWTKNSTQSRKTTWKNHCPRTC